ncbi:hypothetical protein PanWU01x14_216240 [Parasponia andersonii]|uniref:Uncharacterized protein n=1 Tax=Parasponia andersonii TaxID=3476 RepID=A0A2P5BRX0_PARAD|nr:hypothetical protein PanWU01x14_216240 [Parasponia andersonii]
MSQTESNFLTNTRAKTSSLRLKASSSSTPSKQKMYKPNTISKTDAEKMVPYNPVEIGTKGTVGSLVMKEIEYFSQLELSSHGNLEKPRSHVTDMASSSRGISHPSKPTFGSASTTQKKKKKGSSKLLPSMCSMVEVSDKNRPVGISSFSYRNLKTDVKKLHA